MPKHSYGWVPDIPDQRELHVLSSDREHRGAACERGPTTQVSTGI